MNISKTSLSGLSVVETTPNIDSRGKFARLYCANELSNLIGTRKIAHINHSITSEVGAIRGIHFQIAPHAEMKLVRCLRGRVWDVVVDIRQNSATFLQWHAEVLSAANNRMVVIPEGFAHGFQTLEPNSELLYLHTDFYAPEAEGGLNFNDPLLNIDWPLKPTDLSPRDRMHAHIDITFKGIAL